MRRNGERRRLPTLIAVPLSLLDQWYDEVEKHAPELHKLRYYGDEREQVSTKHDDCRGHCHVSHPPPFSAAQTDWRPELSCRAPRC